MSPADCIPVLVETTPAKAPGFVVRVVHWIGEAFVTSDGQLAFRVGVTHELVKASEFKEATA